VRVSLINKNVQLAVKIALDITRDVMIGVMTIDDWYT